MKSIVVSDVAKNELQEIIQTELLKRGFTASIINFELVQGRSGFRFTFCTDNFQTTPVLFKNLVIREFSSSIELDSLIRDDKSIFEFYKFHIGVNVHYEHFDRGQNSSNLFHITGRISDDRVFKIQTS